MIRRPERGKLQWIFLWELQKTPSRECQPGHSLWKGPLWLVEYSANWKPMRQYSSTWLVWSGKYRTNNVPNQTNPYGVAEGRTIVWFLPAGQMGYADSILCSTWWSRCWKKRRRGAACKEMRRVLRLRGSKLDSRLSINKASHYKLQRNFQQDTSHHRLNTQ